MSVDERNHAQELEELVEKLSTTPDREQVAAELGGAALCQIALLGVIQVSRSSPVDLWRGGLEDLATQ